MIQRQDIPAGHTAQILWHQHRSADALWRLGRAGALQRPVVARKNLPAGKLDVLNDVGISPRRLRAPSIAQWARQTASRRVQDAHLPTNTAQFGFVPYDLGAL